LIALINARTPKRLELFRLAPLPGRQRVAPNFRSGVERANDPAGSDPATKRSSDGTDAALHLLPF